MYLSTPLYNAARDDLPNAVAALLALSDTDGKDESGRDQSVAQCTWAPAGAGVLSGALMGYCGARFEAALRTYRFAGIDRLSAYPAWRWLTRRGCSRPAFTAAGETASGVASRLGHSQVLELLARAGAAPG